MQRRAGPNAALRSSITVCRFARCATSVSSKHYHHHTGHEGFSKIGSSHELGF